MDASDIRCFQHCSGDQNILCFSVPDYCPLCGQNVASTGMRIPPYIIHYPFVSALATQCCIVIKPTVGDFLLNFSNNSDLHVGLTNSTGCVYAYDEKGVTREVLDETAPLGAVSSGSTLFSNDNWNRCLSIPMVDAAGRMFDQWDKDIEEFSKGRHWKAEYYDEERHNCFDFVLGFLRHFGLDRVYPSIIDRRLFCQEMVLPATVKAGKYISLYRAVAQNGFVVKNVRT